MRSVLHNPHPTRNLAIDLKTAVLAGLFLVLPFVVLESLNNAITRQNAPGLLVLFGLLWLLPVAFVVILMPIVRTVRVGGDITAKPVNLLLRVGVLALITIMWVSIMNDQMPCFMGVPNCD